MKNKILKFIYNLNYKWLMRNIILMESNPDFADNTKAVFDEMIQRNLNDKYKFIWFVDDSKKFKDIKIKNVKFISRPGNFFDKIKCIYYGLFAKYIIDCNKYIIKKNKNQFRIYLTHGTPLKIAVEYCNKCGEVDYVIQIGDFFSSTTARIFHVNLEKVISIGFPRNDILLNKNQSLIFFNKIKREKTILWMPTYRNHKNNSNLNKGFKYGVPCINNKKELEDLNNLLFKNSILLLIKLHPVENTGIIQKLEFTNIKFISEKDIEFGKTIYNYLPNIDALLTDYSSIYYDYLLLNRPIGLAISDFKEFSKSNELMYDNFEKELCAEFIYNFEDLKKFVLNLIKNNDISKLKREQNLKKFHKYIDDNSSKRLVDFFLENISGGKK